MKTQEWLKDLNQSHERFVDAILSGDGELAILAYTNYVHALSMVLDEVKKSTDTSTVK